MGAGQGKTRRAQTKTKTTPQVLKNLDAWEKWVEQAEIEKISLGDYYLNIKNLNQETTTQAQAEFLIGEVLADAIKCGAVQIPGGATPNDFEIKVEIGDEAWCLAILHKPTDKEGVTPGLILRPDQSMVSEGEYIIIVIHDAIQDSRYHISPQ